MKEGRNYAKGVEGMRWLTFADDGDDEDGADDDDDDDDMGPTGAHRLTHTVSHGSYATLSGVLNALKVIRLEGSFERESHFLDPSAP